MVASKLYLSGIEIEMHDVRVRTEKISKLYLSGIEMFLWHIYGY